jgi:hypothetical protein
MGLAATLRWAGILPEDEETAFILIFTSEKKKGSEYEPHRRSWTSDHVFFTCSSHCSIQESKLRSQQSMTNHFPEVEIQQGYIHMSL